MSKISKKPNTVSSNKTLVSPPGNPLLDAWGSFSKLCRLYFARLIQKDFNRSEDLGPVFITADGTRVAGPEHPDERRSNKSETNEVSLM